MIELQFKNDNGFYPVVQCGDEILVEIVNPIELHFLMTPSHRSKYTSVHKTSENDWVANYEWTINEHKISIVDYWKLTAENKVILNRMINSIKVNELGEDGNGIQFQIQFVQPASESEKWQFCSPATLYTRPEELKEGKQKKVFMDDRLTYPFVLGYNSTTKESVSVSRLKLAQLTDINLRKGKETRYLHKTELGSIGHSAFENTIIYHAYWPYFEGNQSVALDSKLSPVSAYYPLDNSGINMQLSYEIQFNKADNFADAIFTVYKHMAEINAPKVVELPFSIVDSITYRKESLALTYKELANKQSGFFFHFDPRTGYFTEPSGFSSSFNTIPHESYLSTFEYGFTGRQLNCAYILGKTHGGEWLDKGKKVVDFFIEKCVQPSGWMFSLYDLNKDQPFYSFGEKGAPKLHYISHGDSKGNYLRTMVEPALDLLLNYQLHLAKGRKEEEWLKACYSFADFLVQHQSEDGSWYRAYEPDGTPLKNGQGFGDDEYTAKSASSIPILFLLSLWKQEQNQGEKYLKAAVKAGEYILEAYVDNDHYQGGTLDNPNVVDKEASQYTMASLLRLYECTGKQNYLKGADRAAKIFITWNYIWNAPNTPDTDLYNENFKTVGLGGINSIWGGGVVDIYSLFHIRELYKLGKLVHEPLYCQMAEWISIGTQQFLSNPKNLMNFTDIGMQPEGFGVCNQGIDEQMIAKGDIWGTLGWIYAAGIYGVESYLNERSKIELVSL